MLRPSVHTGRRNAADSTFATSASYPYPKPPAPPAATATSRAKRRPAAGAGAAAAATSNNRTRQTAPSSSTAAKSIDQAQLKLSTFQLQLQSYTDTNNTTTISTSPLLPSILAKRQALQQKRSSFLSLLQTLLKTQETLSTSKIWLCLEKERHLERLSHRLELQLQQITHKRRIQELLLKTDPSLTPAEVKAGITHTHRQAHLETITTILETVRLQSKGYEELAKEYATTVIEDAQTRTEDIKWAQNFLPKILEGVRTCLQGSETVRQKFLERYLVRKHNTHMHKTTMERTLAVVGPERARLGEDLSQLTLKYQAEVQVHKMEVERKRAQKMQALRKEVVGREKALLELETFQQQIYEAYEDRVNELKERIEHIKMEVEEWAEMRKEAHVFFGTSLKDVRERLREFEVQRHAELLGMRELLELFDLLQAQEMEEEEKERRRVREEEEEGEEGGYEDEDGSQEEGDDDDDDEEEEEEEEEERAYQGGGEDSESEDGFL